LQLLPEAKWQPNLVPIDDTLYTPLENKPDSPVIICHSPTRRDLKNTTEFIRAVSDLKRYAKFPIELCLIENTPHKECLRLKRAAHVLFDHLQGYFGVSSLEGLSQGSASSPGWMTGTGGILKPLPGRRNYLGLLPIKIICRQCSTHSSTMPGKSEKWVCALHLSCARIGHRGKLRTAW
jgi:hypothetical protein